MPNYIDEEIDVEIREDLMKKVSTIFFIAITSIAPTLWIKDTFLNDKSRVIYRDGYVVQISNGSKVLWRR